MTSQAGPPPRLSALSPSLDRPGMLGKRQRSGSCAEEGGEPRGAPQIDTGTARTPDAVSRPCSLSPQQPKGQPPACKRLQRQQGAMEGRGGQGLSLQRLPDACLLAIFSALSPLDRRVLVPRVCKRWRQLFRNSPPLWQQARSTCSAA